MPVERAARTPRRLPVFSSALYAVGVVLCCGAPAAWASYILAAPTALPGWDPDYNGSVLLFEFSGTGPLQPLPTIPGRPQTLLNDPVSAVFGSTGELFVGNRHGNVGGGVGSIARFLIDASGSYIPNGSITGNGLDAVHGLAFASDGELFAVNFRGDTISRFRFDAQGNALANGVIALGDGNYALGLAFSPDGELFVNDYAGIRRFAFDDTGMAVASGFFTVPAVNPGFIGFSAAGELFVASHDDSKVLRLLFDADGRPVENGMISVPGPMGFAFSPDGEMFVSSHGFWTPVFDPEFGQIARFLFDADDNAIPNGTLATPSLGGLALTEWRVPEPGTFILLGLGLAGLALGRRRKA